MDCWPHRFGRGAVQSSGILHMLVVRETCVPFYGLCVESNEVQFQVIDNGMGISLENQQKLFESQFSTKSSAEGTGLGLSISRRFIRSFNGDLFLKSSEPDKGSVFEIVLPIETKQGRVSA